MKNIFGPVYSRRFGVSLGVDLSPSMKQCNFDCLYCELEPKKAISKQSDVVEVKDIMNDLTEALKIHNNIDVITVTANGEPTLYPHLKELIEEIDKIKDNAATLILSNSTGLLNDDIFQILLSFDEVKLSLDAVTPEIFKKIDRPFSGIDITKIAQKIVEFSKIFKGRLYIEILFVKGLNDTLQEIHNLSNTLLHVECERVDIGTIDRPPAYNVKALTYHDLHEIAMQFDASIPIHIASRKNIDKKPTPYDDDEILNTLSKRALTEDDINILFDDDSKKRLKKLIEESKVSLKESNNIIFYVRN